MVLGLGLFRAEGRVKVRVRFRDKLRVSVKVIIRNGLLKFR